MYGKSASAAGASMTPSSVACVCAVIEVIRVRPPAGAQLIAAHETGARARLHARSSTPYLKYPSPAAVASDEKRQRWDAPADDRFEAIAAARLRQPALLRLLKQQRLVPANADAQRGTSLVIPIHEVVRVGCDHQPVGSSI